MRVHALLLVAGLSCMPATLHAQAPPAAGGQFDGTYRLVSAAPVSATYTAKGGQNVPCPNRAAGPLTISNGRAHYVSETGRSLRGTVGPQGQLVMRVTAPGEARALELQVSGTIDATGTARARQRGYSCSYDFVWQR